MILNSASHIISEQNQNSNSNAQWVRKSTKHTLYQYTSTYDNRNFNIIKESYVDVRWNESHFPAETFERVPTLRNFNYIPSNFNLSEFHFSDNGYNSVLVVLYYEYQNDCPITYDEYIDSIQYFGSNLIVMNEYFDPSDIENPISTVINDDYDHFFSPKLHNRHWLNIQKNIYGIDNGSIFSDK